MRKLKEVVLKELEKDKNSNLADFMSSPRKKILFGQGSQAIACYDMCNRLKIGIDAFMGSQEGNRACVLPQEIDFFLPDKFSYRKDEYDVLLALSEKYYEEVIQMLKENGFVNIYYSSNWKESNHIYRDGFLRAFLKIHGTDVGSEILEEGAFKIYNGSGQPEEYRSMFAYEFFDIIAPSVYDCEDYVMEGSYEHGMVRIGENDTVLDLGANIGMFSCVAAARGGHVYAFEPTPSTRKLLEQNAAFYDNFEIIEYAASNEDGEAFFAVNDPSAGNECIGENTLFSDRLKGKGGVYQIKVKTIKIDTFIKEKQIEKVDFIKADIEGAERYMLMGAQETLRKFAPKLSLCTYHLSDDEEVMTKLILEANPDYKIMYGSKKLYAYVPK